MKRRFVVAFFIFLMIDPLHQFQIHKIIDCSIAGLDVSFTKSSLLMVLITTGTCLFLHIGIRRGSLIPSKMQSICESLFEFVRNIINEQVGSDGLKYTPYIFSLFLFILSANLAGLFPYSFTVTSHIIVTFSLALFVFLGTTILGLVKHKWEFLHTFCPRNVPLFILPLLIPVEIISYFARPVSLSIRLFANMVAGHIMLKMVAGAAIFCATTPALGIFVVLPVGISSALMIFEIFVAVLQAYIFTILSCIYLNSAIHLE
jgi:F-type H+-transporting ATPase subunit a